MEAGAVQPAGWPSRTVPGSRVTAQDVRSPTHRGVALVGGEVDAYALVVVELHGAERNAELP
jgi:hypothetical protein